MKSTKADRTFYRFPRPIEGTIVAFLMFVFYLSMFNPSSVVLDYLGPLGTLARFMNKNHYDLLQVTLFIAVLIHIGEATYAASLCRRHGISPAITLLWVGQTFLLGFPSLLQLTGYKPDRKTK